MKASSNRSGDLKGSLAERQRGERHSSGGNKSYRLLGPKLAIFVLLILETDPCPKWSENSWRCVFMVRAAICKLPTLDRDTVRCKIR